MRSTRGANDPDPDLHAAWLPDEATAEASKIFVSGVKTARAGAEESTDIPGRLRRCIPADGGNSKV